MFTAEGIPGGAVIKGTDDALPNAFVATTRTVWVTPVDNVIGAEHLRAGYVPVQVGFTLLRVPSMEYCHVSTVAE
jgi:hypothetical protein